MVEQDQEQATQDANKKVMEGVFEQPVGARAWPYILSRATDLDLPGAMDLEDLPHSCSQTRARH